MIWFHPSDQLHSRQRCFRDSRSTLSSALLNYQAGLLQSRSGHLQVHLEHFPAADPPICQYKARWRQQRRCEVSQDASLPLSAYNKTFQWSRRVYQRFQRRFAVKADSEHVCETLGDIHRRGTTLFRQHMRDRTSKILRQQKSSEKTNRKIPRSETRHAGNHKRQNEHQHRADRQLWRRNVLVRGTCDQFAAGVGCGVRSVLGGKLKTGKFSTFSTIFSLFPAFEGSWHTIEHHQTRRYPPQVSSNRTLWLCSRSRHSIDSDCRHHKSAPQIYFFDVVQKSNTMIHLMEKTYSANIIPYVISTSKYADCVSKKRFCMESIENKLDIGLDRSLNSICNWVKIYLQSEQKKTDFKPESDIDTVASLACSAVCQHINECIAQIKKTIDGENLIEVLQELGVRFHRIIYEHLLQYQYNTL